MAKLYDKKWHRNPYLAFVCYLRDILIYIFPIKLPLFIIKIMYGVIPDFIFLVHPRRSEDIFRALPFFTLLRKFISKTAIIKMFNYCPPCVIATIKTSEKINGLVVSSFYLPKMLLDRNKRTLKEAYRCIKLCGKTAKKNSYIGLGALWPVVTRRGLALKKYASKKNVQITNGHIGTLISLNFMVDEIAEISGINVASLRILIIGAGKMGSNISSVLASKIKHLGLIDINQKRLDRLEDKLKEKNKNLMIEKFLRLKNTDMKNILNNYHFGICVTSNARVVLRIEDIPDDFVIVDDSRPEAIPRSQGTFFNKIILEGGLIKINKLHMDYDYGFGMDNNVFGCLAEAYILALDKNSILKPTTGDIEIENYYNMYAETAGLKLGDFKSGNKHISEDSIKEIMKQRIRIGIKENV